VIQSVADWRGGYLEFLGGFSDEFRAGAETGTKIFNQKLLVLGRVNIIESLQNGTL